MMNQNPNARHWMRGDLKAYRDGELPAWRHRLTAWHIERCDACRNEAAWLEQMTEQFAGWENDNSPLPRPELRARILACLPAESPLQLAQAERIVMSRASYRPAPRPVWALGSLAALLLLVGGGFALNLHRSTSARQATVSPLVAQTETKQLRVVSIFTAPENSFDGTAAMTTRISVPPSNTSSQPTALAANLSRKEPSSAAASASTPSDEMYSDPTSREAERLASLKIGDMLNAKHQQMAASTKYAPHLPPPSSPVKASAASAPPQIALAVADVSEARQQLQQWAEIAGAKLRVMPEKENAPAVLASNGAAIPAGTLLEMRVPAHFADSLQAHLNQIGRPLTLTGAKSKNQRALILSEAGNVVAPTSVSPSLPTATLKSASGNDNGNAMVTIRVRLLSSEPAMQP